MIGEADVARNKSFGNNRPVADARVSPHISWMAKSDLHPQWYRRLLVLWLFTGPVILVTGNFHNPDGFRVLPSAPPLAEGAYATISWAIATLLVWHPVLLLPPALWPVFRRRKGRSSDAME
jgi:hypothetical protein